MGSISAGVVSYNTKADLRACLASIPRAEADEIVVFDNASPDGSAAMVRQEFPWVRLFASGENLGYGRAANQIMAATNSDYLLLLNADTALQGGSLKSLAAFLDNHSKSAVVGPRLVNADGTLQASCYPFSGSWAWLWDNSLTVGVVSRIGGLRSVSLRAWKHDSAREVPCVKGAAMAIRRTAFNAIDGFDPSFFLYSEEMDLCYRLRKSGWRVDFAPVTTVLHRGEASTSQRRPETALQFFTSALHFHERHYSKFRCRLLRAIITLQALSRWTRASLQLAFVRGVCKRALVEEDRAISRRILFY